MWNDDGRDDSLVFAATTSCQSTRSCSSRRSVHNKTRYVLSRGAKLLRSSKEIPDGQKASLPSVPEIIWAQNKLNGYDRCGILPLFTMQNRFGKFISTSTVDDDVEYCDRKDEMFEEMNERKRAREERLAGLTSEGDPNETSTFTGSRCLESYVS